MIKSLGKLFLAAALTWLPLADASAAVVQITVKDAGGTNRSFNITTNTDITGNLNWNNVICDQAAGTTCASVGTAGSPSTNALTVQAVTLGHGTAANAMRVELPTDGTGTVTANAGTNLNTSALATSANLTAGTMKTQVVDGSGNVIAATSNALNVNVNNANANGSATSANSSPVVIASDQAAVAIKAASGAIVSGAIASGAVASGAFASGSIGSGAIASGAVASGAFASGAFASGSFLNATAGDPCMFQAKSQKNINTASGTTLLVAASGSTKVYVCSFAIVAPSAVAVSLSEGTGATCNTANQAGVMGVAVNGTAANGMSFAANGGLTYGNGGNTIAFTATAANALCLFQSGTAQLAGNITYVQQ